MWPLKFMSPLIRISGATVERRLSLAIDGRDFPFPNEKNFDLNEKGTREEKESDELDLNICARACVLGSHKEIIFLCHRCGWRRSKIEMKKIKTQPRHFSFA
jgi:hypothetical protein